MEKNSKTTLNWVIFKHRSNGWPDISLFFKETDIFACRKQEGSHSEIGG